MRKVIALLTAASAVVGFGASAFADSADNNLQPTNIPTTTVPGPTPDPSPTVPGVNPGNAVDQPAFCPQGSFEGFFHWNEMRNLYVCMLPYVMPFFTETYGADLRMPNFVYINHDSANGVYGENCGDGKGGAAIATTLAYEYCPGDDTIYLGGGALWGYYAYMGDAAAFMAFAHEFGHYIQDLFIPNATNNNTNEARNRAENQADCVSGAWYGWAMTRGWIEVDDDADIEAVIEAVARAEGVSIADDVHGSLEERKTSFEKGKTQGLAACNDILGPVTGVPIIQANLNTPVQTPATGEAVVTQPQADVVYDCLSGSVYGECQLVAVNRVASAAPASCADVWPFTNPPECENIFVQAFERWGANLPQLYTQADRGYTLGYFMSKPKIWTYYAVLDACIYLNVKDTSQQAMTAFAEEMGKYFKGIQPDVFDFFFTNATQIVCPEQVVATPDTGSVTTPPSTTSTTVVSARSVAMIRVRDNQGNEFQRPFSCSEIAFPPKFEDAIPTGDPFDNVDESTVCDATYEAFFTRLVNANPGGFEQYIYSGEIGVYGADNVLAEDRATTGFWACYSYLHMGWDSMMYDDWVRQLFTNSSSMDSNAAWNAAHRYICPGMTPA